MTLATKQIKRMAEGLLMTAGEPLSLKQLRHLLGEETAIETKELRNIMDELTTDYAGRGIELKEVASGYRFQVCADLSSLIKRLKAEKTPHYSRALLETLALIAYKQPITRAEIEDIRGVSISVSIMNTLMEREWIKIIGHKDVPGRPLLYATTNRFLDYFNLKSIQELPILDKLTGLNEAAEQLQFNSTTVL